MRHSLAQMYATASNLADLNCCVLGGPEALKAEMPSFIAVGPPRTGTTWIHGVLYHRAGLPHEVKETRFFDFLYPKGIDWYLAHFATPRQPRGEVCPTYFASADARERIAHHIPGCKIICTLRDPVERAYSQYRLFRSRGTTRNSFEQEVRWGSRIFEISRYAYHLRQWQERFGQENVGVFFYDDLVSNDQVFADAICGFVGVPTISLERIRRFLSRNEMDYSPRSRFLAHCGHLSKMWLHSRRAARTVRVLDRLGVWRLAFTGGHRFPKLSLQSEARMRDLFLPEVEALERLVDRDLSQWKRCRDGLQHSSPLASARSRGVDREAYR